MHKCARSRTKSPDNFDAIEEMEETSNSPTPTEPTIMAPHSVIQNTAAEIVNCRQLSSPPLDEFPLHAPCDSSFLSDKKSFKYALYVNIGVSVCLAVLYYILVSLPNEAKVFVAAFIGIISSPSIVLVTTLNFSIIRDSISDNLLSIKNCIC